MAEMIAGLEILRYQNPNLSHEIYYWARQEKNSSAEIDYVISPLGKILPVEVKSGVQGGMKSLWMFLDDKKLKYAVRSSLENFGLLNRIIKEDQQEIKQVIICPLYALSQMNRLIKQLQGL